MGRARTVGCRSVAVWPAIGDVVAHRDRLAGHERGVAVRRGGLADAEPVGVAVYGLALLGEAECGDLLAGRQPRDDGRGLLAGPLVARRVRGDDRRRTRFGGGGSGEADDPGYSDRRSGGGENDLTHAISSLFVVVGTGWGAEFHGRVARPRRGSGDRLAWWGRRCRANRGHA